jgi:transposase-like protein
MVYHKLAQAMLERDSGKPLSGKVEMHDAYWGGKRKGKRGRGSAGKTPFVAAVEKNADGHPQSIKLQVVSGIKKSELERWAKQHLQPDAAVVSDGLHCFKAVTEAGRAHEATIGGDSRDSARTAAFNWVNTILGNLKTALAGVFHTVSKEHLPRHLATFQYRFNRRCILKDMIPRLAYVALRTPPMPQRLLKLAGNYW